LEFLIVSAQAVEIGTSNFIDPDSGTKIVEGIRKYCEENDIIDIHTLIGTIDLSNNQWVSIGW
jgi:dihydroorotate dehydrogenase (NAD+) catalytic subunit